MTGSSRSFSYHPALDGVRAFSVTAVLLFHGGVVALGGGFLGVLLLAPERVLRADAGRPIPAPAVTVVRVLGLRHLLQAGVAAALPTGPVAGLGALVDTAHAGSCAGVAAWSSRWRRAALIDLLVESAFAASGWSAGRR